MNIIQIIKKIISFIIRYIIKDPLLIFYYIPAVFSKKYLPYGKIDFIENIKFNRLIESGKSIIRFGDGEMAILHGQDIGYQKFDKKLRNYFKEIITKYNNDSKYIIGIPYYINQSNEELKKDSLTFSIWLHLKVEFVRSFNYHSKYFDAHFFYQKDNALKFIENHLLNHHLIFVTNLKTINKIKNSNIYSENNFKSLHFIETPAKDSFENNDKIINEIDCFLKENYQNKNQKDIKIIFSAGPASKVLVYLYSNKNYISYDIGYGIRYLWDQTDVSYKI